MSRTKNTFKAFLHQLELSWWNRKILSTTSPMEKIMNKYANKQDSLQEMNEFLKSCNLPRLNHV